MGVPIEFGKVQLFTLPEDRAPRGVPVLVPGGIAMKDASGRWYTGMEEPLFSRPLEWTPEWWAYIPTGDSE